MPIKLATNIQKLKYDVLTPIQKLFIPYMQNNKDVVAVAETGSGKTVAYLFPLVGNMLIKGTPKNPYLNNNNNFNYKSKSFPLSLILVPTRELAEQVSKESKKMCFKTGIRTVAVYGGVKKYDQICELR
jgi:superfamily II DNA/RNA helicase